MKNENLFDRSIAVAKLLSIVIGVIVALIPLIWGFPWEPSRDGVQQTINFGKLWKPEGTTFVKSAPTADAIQISEAEFQKAAAGRHVVIHYQNDRFSYEMTVGDLTLKHEKSWGVWPNETIMFYNDGTVITTRPASNGPWFLDLLMSTLIGAATGLCVYIASLLLLFVGLLSSLVGEMVYVIFIRKPATS